MAFILIRAVTTLCCGYAQSGSTAINGTITDQSECTDRYLRNVATGLSERAAPAHGETRARTLRDLRINREAGAGTIQFSSGSRMDL
jgi:hypothetical protein